MPKAFIIFSGYNQRAVIAFIRTLERHSLHYFVIASDKKDSIFKTKYASRVVYIREFSSLTIENLIIAIDAVTVISSGFELILAPSTESINRFFLDHRGFFENRGIQLPLVDKSLYEKVSDKKKFEELCKEHDIKVPMKISNPVSCQLPFVAKPIAFNLKEGLTPILIFSEPDRNYIMKNSYLNSYYFQEFIYGRSFYLLLFLSRNGKVFSFSQENLIQQPQGKSIIAAIASDFHTSYESERYIAMLKAINFYGLVMIEIRQQGSNYYMIEANPRFWGPSQLFVDAMKEDLFDAFLVHQGFTELKPKISVKNGRYFWYEGLVNTMRSGMNIVYHNYSPVQMAMDFPNWIEADIYRREDTIDVFIQSTNQEVTG